MSCNCPTPNTCPETQQCLCGITLDIYNSQGILVESTEAAPYFEDIFFDFQSVIWNIVLGQHYELTIQYNNILSRWELSYFNNELNQDIVIGVLYGDDTCPVSNCWDLSCNAIAFDVLGVFETAFFWQGTYQNGKKSYTFTSDWSGPDINYRIYWIPDSYLFPGSSAPPGTPAWVLEAEVGVNVWASAGFLFNSNECPFGFYIGSWEGETTRYSFSDLGVTGFDLKTSAVDCGCCDDQVTINIDGTECIAYIVKDEYGNVLGINGKQYYSFTYNLFEYILCFDVANWVIKLDDTIVAIIHNGEPQCPYGTVEVLPNFIPCNCISVTLNYAYADPVQYTANLIGTYNDHNLYEFIDGNILYYIWFDGDYWRISYNNYGLNSIAYIESKEPITCPAAYNWDSEIEILLSASTTVCNIENISIIGSECFDCCDYYTPRNRNLLKKKKAIFVDEISSIRNKEIFGMKCGPEWSDLFKKHLIFDVLWCLPYGVLCDDEEQCLINNLNENCNC
jgi:hypothetical protein